MRKELIKEIKGQLCAAGIFYGWAFLIMSFYGLFWLAFFVDNDMRLAKEKAPYNHVESLIAKK